MASSHRYVRLVSASFLDELMEVLVFPAHGVLDYESEELKGYVGRTSTLRHTGTGALFSLMRI